MLDNKETVVEEEEVEVVDEESTEEVKTYTQEEVEKMLQSEADKRVTKALQTSKQKWEEEYLAKLEQEKSEAEKLAKMSEEERFQAKLQEEKEQFEKERQEFMQQKMEMQTIKELQANNLPVDFAQYLVAEDAETVKSNIEAFKEQWTVALEEQVESRLRGKTPTTTNTNGKAMSKEEFASLTFDERVKLYKENPELYEELSK